MREKKVKGPLDPIEYYVFNPVVNLNNELIVSGEGLSIEEDDVDNYLLPILLKYFSNELVFNQQRSDEFYPHIKDFCWNNTSNYYSIQDINTICNALEDISIALITNQANETIDLIKENVEEFNPNIILDFYHYFVTRIRLMLSSSDYIDAIAVVAP